MENERVSFKKSFKSKKRFSAKAAVSSFPQYVSKVQSKMNELRQQALANKAKYHGEQEALTELGHGDSEGLSAKRHIGRRNATKRNRRNNLLSSCFGDTNKNNIRESSGSKLRSTALPRILSPINRSGTNIANLSARSGKRESLLQTKKPSTRSRQNRDHGEEANFERGLQKTREESPHPFPQWSRNPRHLPADPSQCLAALPVPRSPHLSIPSPKPLGSSNHSLTSSTGSSTTSSNVSTPVPPSPSPISFFVGSKSSLSSTDHSPPPVRHKNTHLPPLVNPSNQTLNVSSTASVQKTSSLPQLGRRVNTSARKTPTHSLGRSPARSPVFTSYIMPVTKLNPIVRPQPARNVSSGRSECSSRRSELRSSGAGENDDGKRKTQLSSTRRGSHDSSHDLNENALHQTPSCLSIRVDVPVSIETNTTDYEHQHCGGSPQATPPPAVDNKELMIPTITIRSATPIKTPSEDSTSLASLCQKFVFDT